MIDKFPALLCNVPRLWHFLSYVFELSSNIFRYLKVEIFAYRGVGNITNIARDKLQNVRCEKRVRAMIDAIF